MMDRPTLLGQCVRLEPLGPEHVSSLEKNFNPSLFRFYPKTDYRSAQEFCEENWACEKTGNFEPYAIIDQASHQVIGCVEYSSIDQKNKSLEIGGSWLGLEFQGGPWNSEAKLLLLTEAFEKRNCIRVQFKTDSLNIQSQSALHQIGARNEGTLRNSSIQPDGRIRHDVIFSVIREDWPEVKEHLQARLAKKLKTK
jgi:RimJ/RimL family protein N-acetyltransferase